MLTKMTGEPKHKIKSKNTRITGVLSVTRRGIGYLSSDRFEEDIEIPAEFLNTALDKDAVEVIILPKVEGERISGQVVKIVERAKTNFVGVIDKENDLTFLIPDDKRMYTDILIPDAKVKNGMKALVKITRWTDPKRDPEGRILRVLGPKGAHDVEMESVVLEQGFDTKFSREMEREAEAIERAKRNIASEAVGRKDFREAITFTIDPKDAKDFDDALSISELPGGNFEIGIHIADVSHFVRSGSAIDTEAQKRGTSIYLVDRTIPMLPEVLSNDVCSLNPHEDKLAFSAVFTISREGKVLSRWFGETLINSDMRFTYEKAQDVLNSKEGEYFKELNALNNVAHKLREERFKNGSISFDHDEVEFELDKNGKPLKITKKKRLDTNLLVEDFMLLANREVAEYFYEHCAKTPRRDMLFVYRTHDVPNREKIEELGVFLRAIGYEFNTKGGDVSAQEINKLFKQIEGKPEEDLIKTATIRSMAKAVYSTKNIGHFGLAFKYYTHFTSPIRRYPDVMVHRILKHHLNGTMISYTELKKYEKLAITSSEREVAAVEAERDSIRYKQVEYMKDRIGKTFDGTITGVTEWGIYVADNETKSEGMVRLSNLKDDFYTLDKKRYRLLGERTKKKYSLGDRVKIKLTSADLDEKTLDFAFV
jgi:ribonuclease R